MPTSNTNQPPRYTRFSVMDFNKFTESMHTSFTPDHPIPCLGESDLNFVINAPVDYCAPTNSAIVTLYFDQANCSRALQENSYQVRCSRLLNTHEFMKWAEQCVNFVTHVFMNQGLVCMDIADLIQVLKASKSKKLILEVIFYENYFQVPWAKLQNFRFKNLFAALFAGNDLSLQMFSDLGLALEEISPDMNVMKLAAHFHSGALPAVLLLGELAP